MENSDSDYKAAIARNQFNPGAAMTTGDTPVEIMLDILFNMVKAFAEGVMEGYKGANKKGPAKGQQGQQGQAPSVQELQQMTQTMTQMMQTIMQMMQTQQLMQQQTRQAQSVQQTQQVQQQTQQVQQPAQQKAQPKPEQPGVQQGQPKQVQQGQPKQAQQTQPQSAGTETSQSKAGASQAQQGQVKPSEMLRLFREAAKKTGGMRWFSDVEINKTIDALNKMKEKDGKLSNKGRDFLDRMTELKDGIQKQKDGNYAKLYVRAYDAAYEFAQENTKNGRKDEASAEAKAMADMVFERLNENQRIYTLRNVVPQVEKKAKKEAGLSQSDREKIEKQKAADSNKKEKMYEKARSEVKKARENQRSRAVKKDPLSKGRVM
jgi:hypothetical protein